MSRWTKVALLASVTALSGCQAVGPNFVSPTPPRISGYSITGDAAPAIAAMNSAARSAGPWWRGLGSTQLDAVIRGALRDNASVALAVASLDRARAEQDVATADRKPKIDANAGAIRERINIRAFGFSGFPGQPTIPNPTISLFSVGSTVSYGLDLFGLTRRRIEVAGAAVDAEARRADAAFLALTGNVALEAVRIATLREEQTVLGDIVADDRASIDIVRRAQTAGGESLTAGLGGEAQLEADQALAPPVAQDLSRARHALAAFSGRAPEPGEVTNFSLTDFSAPRSIPVSLPTNLLRLRPDILAAEADLHADTARIGVATANLYPNINLVAGLSQQALTPASIFSFNSTAYDFGAQVTAPIFHGGALRASRRAAEAEARVSLGRYLEVVARAFVQVADVLTALARDEVAMANNQAREATARRGLADAQAAFQLGGGPRADIVIAKRRLDLARLNTVQASGLRLEDVVTLYAATATDWGKAPAS